MDEAHYFFRIAYYSLIQKSEYLGDHTISYNVIEELAPFLVNEIRTSRILCPLLKFSEKTQTLWSLCKKGDLKLTEPIRINF